MARARVFEADIEVAHRGNASTATSFCGRLHCGLALGLACLDPSMLFLGGDGDFGLHDRSLDSRLRRNGRLALDVNGLDWWDKHADATKVGTFYDVVKLVELLQCARTRSAHVHVQLRSERKTHIVRNLGAGDVLKLRVAARAHAHHVAAHLVELVVRRLLVRWHRLCELIACPAWAGRDL